MFLLGTAHCPNDLSWLNVETAAGNTDVPWQALVNPGVAAASACGAPAHVNVVAVTRLPVTPETSSSDY